MKLEERDKRILALIGTEPRSVSTLAVNLDISTDELSERLAALADNGLVNDLGDGQYERTESGRRVLITSTPDIDERIDTPAEIEQAIGECDLRTDEADAVRHVFAFLQYWGRVTETEILDAVYSEAPAGRDTPQQWWDEVVREPLASLPGVEQPSDEGEAWRYAGTPEVSEPFPDGRRVLSPTHPTYGNVKHALESIDLTEEERDAARVAFEYLYQRSEVTEQEVSKTVYPEHSMGFESPQVWWDEVVRDTFEALPGVEQTNESTWQYRGL